MKDVKIGIHEAPPVRCYQMYAYPLSVIWRESEKAIPWFFSNFINMKICVHRKVDYEFMDLRYIQPRYELCEFYDCHSISQSIFEKGYIKDFTVLLKNLISNGYTASFFVDEFYIPNRLRYEKEHKRHQIMVFGYDTQKSIYHILGYNANYAFTCDTIKMDVLEQSFYRYQTVDQCQDVILAMGLKEEKKLIDFNLQQLVKETEEYLSSQNTYCPEVAQYHYQKEFSFGLKVYEVIKSFLIRPEYSLTNHPMFYMIYEHKKNFQNRLKYIQNLYRIDLEGLINYYEDITNKAKHMLNIYLKYLVCNNPGRKEKFSQDIVSILDCIVKDEKSLLCAFLDKLPYA